MKGTTATCLTWTTIFLTAAGASGWFVYRRAPSAGAAFVGALVGGVILLIAIAFLVGIVTRIRELALILRARLGGEPRDGKRVALIGTLRGHGELTSPFSRQRCVLYEYAIVSTRGEGNETSLRKVYEGFAMVPLTIDHGGERTRILAKPQLPAVKGAQATSHAHAQSYVEHTTFTPPPKSEDEPDLANTDGHLRYDYRRDPAEANLLGCALTERVLPPDASVCALGRYRADRHALVAPVTLRVGEAFAIGAAWRMVTTALVTVIFTAIGLIALAVFCANFPLDAVEQSHPHWNIRWWEVDLERFVERNVRAPLVRAGAMHSIGFHLQELCEGCARGRLEIDGRTIELKHARYAGGRAVHLSAKPGDRDGVTLDGKDRVVLTIDGKSAPVPASWLQPNDIQTSLGSEGEYAGRVTVIAPDRWIRCRVYFNTRVDENAWL